MRAQAWSDSLGRCMLGPGQRFPSLKARCPEQGRRKQHCFCAGQTLGPSAGRGTGQGRMQAQGRGSGQVQGQAPASSSHMVPSTGPGHIPGHGLESLGSLPSLSPIGPGNLLNPPSGLGNLFNAEVSSANSASGQSRLGPYISCKISKLPTFTAVSTSLHKLSMTRVTKAPAVSSKSSFILLAGWTIHT